MAPQIERVSENYELAEGPYWDEDTKSLYFVDIFSQLICKYVPATKKVTKAKIGGIVSIIIPVKDQKNNFIITKDRELLIINWNGENDSFSVVKNIKTENDKNFNDGKCDPTGRLWIGTLALKPDMSMDVGKGALYYVEKDRQQKVADGITLSNGLAFNTELNKLYYVDTHTATVDEFDLNVEEGTIANRRAIFTLSKHNIPGSPDGMTIDSDGNLWVAIFNGGRVIKIDPRKPETLLYTLSFPAKQVTSVAFGGNNLDELYVTTGLINLPNEEKLERPENGSVYRVTGLGARGVPSERFVL